MSVDEAEAAPTPTVGYRPRIQVGRDYMCPQCERLIPTRKQRMLAKPAKFTAVLNDILVCPHCQFYFSPKADALNVVSQ